MRILYLLIIIEVLLDCALKMQESKQNTEGQKGINPSLETEIILETPIVEKQQVPIAGFIFVDIMQKFHNQDDFYIPLYYRESYSESLDQMLKAARQEVIYKDSETTRIKIDPEVASEILLLDELDRLLVYNSEQEIIDTVEMQYVEYYDEMIEAQYVASYTAPLQEEKYLVMSFGPYHETNLKKSAKVLKDSTIINTMIKRKGYNIDYLYSFGVMHHENDTISYLSFFDKSKFLECTYLLKGCQAVDSIINTYVIKDLTPVPLATNFALTYVASSAVPETDNMWTSLVGIDLMDEKFVHYPRNRISLSADP
jgi:hypothetical protein